MVCSSGCIFIAGCSNVVWECREGETLVSPLYNDRPSSLGSYIYRDRPTSDEIQRGKNLYMCVIHHAAELHRQPLVIRFSGKQLSGFLSTNPMRRGRSIPTSE